MLPGRLFPDGELLNFHRFNMLYDMVPFCFQPTYCAYVVRITEPPDRTREGMEIWRGFPFRAPTPDLFSSSFFLLPLGLARENPYAKVVSTSFEFFSEGGGGCTQASFDYISKNVLQAALRFNFTPFSVVFFQKNPSRINWRKRGGSVL